METEFLGEKFKIERIGTDGDWDEAINMIRRLDGKVDAFGMGGISLYIYVGSRRYILKDAKKLLLEAKKTPIVDGGGLKNILEKQSIERVAQEGIVDFKGRHVLMLCGVDRLGMDQVLNDLSDHIVFGDLIYGLGLPIRVRSLKALERIAGLIAPVVVNLPFDSLYPTGSKQDVIIPKFSKYYYEADIIAGDFLYIKRLPAGSSGRLRQSSPNTTTQEDLKLLQERGVKLLVTTTPEMEGRSFGTNVMEALLVSIIGKPVDLITEQDYRSLLRELDFRPGVMYLNQ